MAEDTLGCLSNALPENWWRDPVTLKHEVSVHGGQTEAALAHSCAPATISKWWVRAGFPKQDGGRRADHPVLLSTDDQWLMDALKKAGDNASLHDVADAADVSSKRVREAIDRLAIQGIRISLDENTVRVLRSVPASETTSEAQPGLFNGDIVRFGVVSDTHLGSKECRLTELKTAYSIFEREGIEQVIHPGDLVAGMGIYRHQLRDLAVIGFDAQVEYAVAEYPRVEGIKTLIVGGNHDIEGDFGRQASDPVKAFCSQRDDFEHLGDYSAFLTFPNGAMGHILHPGGGGSYAMSYRAQKIAEAYEGGAKPNFTLFGHWHRRGAFEARSIQLLLCGTFEGSTSLAKRYGLGEPALGFHIVEARMSDDGSLVEWNPRWYPFYRGRVEYKGKSV